MPTGRGFLGEEARTVSVLPGHPGDLRQPPGDLSDVCAVDLRAHDAGKATSPPRAAAPRKQKRKGRGDVLRKAWWGQAGRGGATANETRSVSKQWVD